MAVVHTMGKTPAADTDSNREMLNDAQSMKALKATIKTMKATSPGKRERLVCISLSVIKSIQRPVGR
jgi:hypothetical protein